MIEIGGKRFRIVDLSEKVLPGKVIGAQPEPPYFRKRRYEVRPFEIVDGEWMSEVDMESHISTHVEAPMHLYGEKGKDITEIPLESYMGEAIFIDLSGFKPEELITPDYLEKAGVRRGDIVIMGNSAHEGKARPILTPDSGRWLVKMGIKMLGWDTSVSVDDVYAYAAEEAGGGAPSAGQYVIHNQMCSHEIPIVERLVDLNQLKKKRFFFSAAPPKMGGVEAFSTRAIALEPVNEDWA